MHKNMNMDYEENSEITTNEDVLHEFPFCRLSEIHSMDYEAINKAAEILKPYVATEKFYENSNGCFGYTLDFIVTYSSFLIKNVDSGSVLSYLLNLLEDIVSRINAFTLQINPDDINRILSLLIKLMESSLQNAVKFEGGKIVAGIIQMQNIGCLCNDENLYLLISQVCTFFEEQSSILELSRLVSALLKRRAETKIEINLIIKWLETYCTVYLKRDTDPQLLQQLLECILSYYSTRKEYHAVTDKLKQYLWRLCIFMSHPLLRNHTEQLLAILVEELYCSDTFNWPGGRTAILMEIEALPNNYKEWPNTGNNIFFVIAYLLFLHSRMLWNHTVIWESLNRYLTMHIFPQRPLLKALAMLYPLVVRNSSVPNTHDNSKTLLDVLGTCKSLPAFLTYHPTQMTWLLTNAKGPLKNLVLVSWLRAQNEDAQILGALDATKMGFLLVKFLLRYPDIPLTSRVSQLIAKLTPEPTLENTIGLALPLICNRPTIFAQLLQVKPTIPSDPIQILDLIKVASASLPFLTQDAAIQATCSYSVRLLTAIKQPNALLMFCHYSISIKFLVAKSAAKDDSTALATINLLRRLVKNQVQNHVKMNNSTLVQFTKMLQGNSQRVSAGLKLLLTLLSCRNQVLLLNIPKQCFFGLHHHMHSLIRQHETAPTSLQVLTELILRENNLAFSLVTPHSLRLICNKDMDQQTTGPFLEFLAVWLNCVTRHQYIEVPVSYLQFFLNWIGCSNDICHRIMQLLNNYTQGQHRK